MDSREIYWLLKEKYGGVESEAFHADCERLAAGEPLAYIIGSIPFLNCTIYLDSKPLIPRPETEFWVDKAKESIPYTLTIVNPDIVSNRDHTVTIPKTNYNFNTKPKKNDIRVLDLCAGSGAIGIAIAKYAEDIHVTIAEIDPAHIPTIKKNIEANLHYQNIPRVIQSDLFSNLKDCVFDYIFCNPPYIDKDAESVAESVALHEPHLALFGGKDGLEIIERVISGAKAALSPHGQLWLEHEPFQSEAIQKLAKQNGFSCRTEKDQYHTERYSILTLNVAK